MAHAERTAEVVWEGNLTQGRGTVVSSGSGALGELPVTWASRVERPDGRTSPEELIAAAHAACYAMSLSNTLNEAGNPPERVTIAATSGLELGDEGLRITSVDLAVRGSVPGMEAGQFERLAEEAERRCPVSNALRGNVEIRVRANLEG